MNKKEIKRSSIYRSNPLTAVIVGVIATVVTLAASSSRPSSKTDAGR